MTKQRERTDLEERLEEARGNERTLGAASMKLIYALNAVSSARDVRVADDVRHLNDALRVIQRRRSEAAALEAALEFEVKRERGGVDLNLSRRQKQILMEVSHGARVDRLFLDYRHSIVQPYRQNEAVDYVRTVRPLVDYGYLEQVNNERGYLAYFRITRKGLAIFGREDEYKAG